MARNKYPEETKKLIVDTAARLFMEKGYDHTSIQDIIDNLAVSRKEPSTTISNPRRKCWMR